MFYLGLLGSGIQNSLSPALHEAFARQQDFEIQYQLVDFPMSQWNDKWEAVRQLEFHGVNITAPYKEKVLRHCHQLTPQAERAGAVNTVLFSDGKVLGHNTDGQGFMEHLNSLGWGVMGRRVLILGAGGVVRGILGPLLDAQPESVHLVTRDPDRITRLQASPLGSDKLSYSTYEAIPDHAFDLIIHGTPAVDLGELPDLSRVQLAPEACCYDLNYRADITAFLQWANAQGCDKVSDGMGMLVAQAAAAFYLWFGVKPTLKL